MKYRSHESLNPIIADLRKALSVGNIAKGKSSLSLLLRMLRNITSKDVEEYRNSSQVEKEKWAQNIVEKTLDSLNYGKFKDE